MNIIAIDLGNYSVKFFESSIDRKQLTHENIHEVTLHEARVEYGVELSIEELHFRILKKFMQQIDYEAKVIYQVPNKIVTSRLLVFPVSNRKKAESMIPFQLEEDVPLGSGDIHYGLTFKKHGEGLQALIAVTDYKKFEEYHNSLQELGLLPQILTTEMGVYDATLQAKPFKDGSPPHCILDLGHQSTKAYLVKDGQVVAQHFSYVAGQAINEVLSKTYDISVEDAISYKHQNAYVLTSEQYERVNDDQREFALLMKRVLAPLVQDIRRWFLGFKVTHNETIQNIYICGGTSNLKNIQNFLAEELSTEIEFWSPYQDTNFNNFPLSDNQKRAFVTGHLMGLAHAYKQIPLNLRSKDFASSAYEDIPLHSASFIGIRMIAVMSVIMIVLLLESLTYQSQSKVLDKRFTKLIKNETLGLVRRDRNSFKKSPKRVLRKLKKKKKEIEQQVKFLSSSLKINAISPLGNLSNLLNSHKEIQLESFNSSDGIAKGTFNAKTSTDYKNLKRALDDSSLPGLKVIEISKGSKLTVEFGY